MKRKEIVLIMTLSLVTALSLFQPGCLKTPEAVDRPTKTPESTDLPQKAPEFAIDPQFDSAGSFSEGLALVMVGGKEGYIDKEGRIVIDPQFNDAWSSFSEGLAPVKFDWKWGYIKNPLKQ